MTDVTPAYKFGNGLFYIGPAKIVSFLSFIALVTVVPYFAKFLFPVIL